METSMETREAVILCNGNCTHYNILRCHLIIGVLSTQMFECGVMSNLFTVNGFEKYGCHGAVTAFPWLYHFHEIWDCKASGSSSLLLMKYFVV